tara:strand:- start:1127 stop:1381 length:255 start_codon:yes stop_codon:yes gene_type:complete
MIKWIILLLMPILSYSHPGPTDSRGGHWDNSTGSHHYHNKTPYIPPKLNTFSSKDDNKNNSFNNNFEKKTPKEKIEDKRFNFLF